MLVSLINEGLLKLLAQVVLHFDLLWLGFAHFALVNRLITLKGWLVIVNLVYKLLLVFLYLMDSFERVVE